MYQWTTFSVSFMNQSSSKYLQIQQHDHFGPDNIYIIKLHLTWHLFNSDHLHVICYILNISTYSHNSASCNLHSDRESRHQSSHAPRYGDQISYLPQSCMSFRIFVWNFQTAHACQHRDLRQSTTNDINDIIYHNTLQIHMSLTKYLGTHSQSYMLNAYALLDQYFFNGYSSSSFKLAVCWYTIT